MTEKGTPYLCVSVGNALVLHIAPLMVVGIPGGTWSTHCGIGVQVSAGTLGVGNVPMAGAVGARSFALNSMQDTMSTTHTHQKEKVKTNNFILPFVLLVVS
jgi:hypothetical protein